MPRIAPTVFLIALSASHAWAVIVRGHVTTPLGAPLAGARIQLIQGRRSVADTIAGADGEYEIRTSFAGRFLLLTAPSIVSAGYAPQVGYPFYAGRADLVTRDIVLNRADITPQVSSQSTLTARHVSQAAIPVTQIAADEFLTRVRVSEELRRSSGVVIVEYGEAGSPALLYLRGAPPAALQARLEGVEANELGGPLDLSTVSTSGLAAITSEPAVELGAGANPLYFVGAEAGVLDLRPTIGESLQPTLTYTGDGGNLGAFRNEAVASYAHGRTDLLGSFSRFDIEDDLPGSAYHLVAWSGDIGYHVSAGTSLRVRAREDVSAAALSNPYELFLVAPKGREAHQNICGSARFETVSASGWHNVVRYGLARKRAQTFDYFTPAKGLPVTIRGANGFTVSGTATFLPQPPREDAVTTRDEGVWQSDYRYKPWLVAVGEFRFENEGAADFMPGDRIALGQQHLSGALGLSGEVKHRFFYEASGLIDHSGQLGLTGTPRMGATYAAVRPAPRKFRGTTLHLAAAAGTREPSLLEEAARQGRPQSPRSRTLDASVDQNILSEKLVVRVTYFHSQYSHEFEPVGLSVIASQPALEQTLALLTQGLEINGRYHPFPRIRLEAGYTYLAASTEQSATPVTFNPTLSNLPIGALSALRGQRPFHRPPQSFSFLAEYSGSRLNLALKGSAVSRSDDSTNLLQSPGLLLPNLNLSPGYAALDANVSVAATAHVTVFSQLTNLTNDRHMAPIGYLSTPFLARAGLRIRLGRK